MPEISAAGYPATLPTSVSSDTEAAIIRLLQPSLARQTVILLTLSLHPY